MVDGNSVYVLAIAVLVVSGLLGAYVAMQKGRPLLEGFIIAALFPGIGAIVEGVLPDISGPSE